MKIVRFTLLSALCGSATAFVPPASPRTSTTSISVVDTIDMNAVDPSIISDPTAIIGAVGAAVAAAAAGFAKGFAGDNSGTIATSKTSKADVSIPYNAAAQLAYDSYAASSSKKVSFDTFKSLYEAQMVAEVKAKSQMEKVTVKKVNVEEMKAQLASLESELAGLEGDSAALNDEAGDYKSQVESLFA